MAGPLFRLLISSRSVNKHGRHRQLLFLIRFIWPSGFRGEDIKKSTNQKQELPMAAMLVNVPEPNEQSLEKTFHRCFLQSFTSSGKWVSEEKIKM
jgi:hypothetical protein